MRNTAALRARGPQCLRLRNLKLSIVSERNTRARCTLRGPPGLSEEAHPPVFAKQAPTRRSGCEGFALVSCASTGMRGMRAREEEEEEKRVTVAPNNG